MFWVLSLLFINIYWFQLAQDFWKQLLWGSSISGPILLYYLLVRHSLALTKFTTLIFAICRLGHQLVIIVAHLECDSQIFLPMLIRKMLSIHSNIVCDDLLFRFKEFKMPCPNLSFLCQWTAFSWSSMRHMPMATAQTHGAAPIFPFRLHRCILEYTLNHRVT
jgi:hypothetical protein